MNERTPRRIDSPKVQARLRRRHRAERRFRLYGRVSVIFAIIALAWLLISVGASGLSAFTSYSVQLNLTVETQTDIGRVNAGEEGPTSRSDIIQQSVLNALRQSIPHIDERDDRDRALGLISMQEVHFQLNEKMDQSDERESFSTTLTVPLSDIADQTLKGHINRQSPEAQRPISNEQLVWLDRLRAEGLIERRFNARLLTRPDSRDPERAGIASALIGSVMILMLAAVIALPIGIGSAIYLEEFAPESGLGQRVTGGLEIMINNLAAIPSIVFGLLGLAVFINFMGLARSIPLVGGLVLALRMFPVLIIAARAALQAVPSTIVDGALALGATRSQAVFGQKVPIAAPGILTGAILALAQALGETAPLLMIGMVAFVTTVPTELTDPATALPVQIFIWSDSAERAWLEKTSAAIILLLMFLLLMNGLAIALRARLQKRLL